MTLVVDSSAVVATPTSTGLDGEWPRASMLRRSVLAGHLARDLAALVHDELVQLRVRTVAFEPLAARVWALHPPD